MSHNTFGHLFRVTTFGESHGAAIGAIIDGCPPNIEFALSDLQNDLDKRKPGTSKFVTQRQEADQVKVLSGVLESSPGVFVTTGTPIALLIENTDQRSKDYDDIAKAFRPGHADYTYFAKYGIRDHRGGGRSSARETAMRVAAGAIAKKIIPQVKIQGALVQMGDVKINREAWDWQETLNNPFFCPDKAAAKTMETYLEAIRKDGNSIGAIIEVVASGAPVGWGAPLYGKMDAELASAMMSINAVKGVEIGAGFTSATLTGEQNADEMSGTLENPIFASNHAGGILGGITTGQDIVVRFAVKPASSILKPKQTLNENSQPTQVITKGRHDPCVGIRAVPVGEAMMACVLADHYLRHKAQNTR